MIVVVLGIGQPVFAISSQVGGIDRCSLEGLGDLSKMSVSYMSMERLRWW